MAFAFNRMFRAGMGFMPLFVMLYACKEKYFPEIDVVNPNYLVIDGFINTGADSTIFKISRSFKLENKPVSAPEKGAIVTVETEAGASFNLTEITLKPGTYAIPVVSQDQTKKYRLRVRTKDGRQYLSEFVESKVSPPVEVTYDFRHDNLNMYANTSDPAGRSFYYHYTYVETWEYTSELKSVIKVVNNSVVDREFPKDNIYNCYHTAPSTKIDLFSTAALTQDRVADFPLAVIPAQSEKLRLGYSILVKQHVLTKAGFDFYETLRNNTERLGGVFDSQPSQLYGNIKCTTNPEEFVIGFISAGTTTQQRVTLYDRDMPFPRRGYISPENCYRTQDQINDLSTVFRLNPIYLITYYEVGTLMGHLDFRCVDCRLQGGSNVTPSYWKR